eukprot:TRINITY_DN9409_c0_g1_i3.p1 TRINITY_DN9409_c0_g1~~TRINITY_DN9409_c0_g1_i3.p1  ORF type:complete len:194 (+),score=54.15 TRINITY_DN9409_c0_g1_i3:316-897(+)
MIFRLVDTLMVLVPNDDDIQVGSFIFDHFIEQAVTRSIVHPTLFLQILCGYVYKLTDFIADIPKEEGNEETRQKIRLLTKKLHLFKILEALIQVSEFFKREARLAAEKQEGEVPAQKAETQSKLLKNLNPAKLNLIECELFTLKLISEQYRLEELAKTEEVTFMGAFEIVWNNLPDDEYKDCLLYTSPSPRDS